MFLSACVLAFTAFFQDDAPVVAVEPQELRIGHWAEVRGELDEDGRFVASKLELSEAQEYEQILGTVASHDVAGQDLVLLGQPVSLSEKTEWTDLEPTNLTGRRVRIEGRYRGPSKFSARDVRERGEGRDRISGRIDGVRLVEGGVELDIMRWVVWCPTGTPMESSLPAESFALIERRWTFEQNAGRVDEEDLVRESFEIRPNLRFGGQLELSHVRENEFDLDQADDEDRVDTEAVARLRLAWMIRSDLFARAEGRFRQRWRDDQEDGSSDDFEARFGETWLYWRDALGAGTDVQFGRQDFDDPREWIYDQDLDGVRLVHTANAWRADLAATTTLGAGDPRDEGAFNLSGYLSTLDEDEHLAAWFVHRDFDASGDGRLTHLGVRAIGEWFDPLDLWAELSGVSGEEFGRDVAGWAYDVGFTARGDDAPLAFSAGYAFGSGDDGTGDDGAYRQTGLNDNNGKLGTATSLRYYGELLQPELSNLAIGTVALSWWLGERTSLALLAHDYRQAEAANFLRDVDIDPDPTGLDRHVGNELDLVFGSRAIANLDLEISAGVFLPGDAFAQDDAATFVKLQVRYNF
jgi:hypothetical protein